MTGLKRSLGLLDATGLGIGAIIGAGIFVVFGIAAGVAGPGVVLSILVAAGVSSFTAVSYIKLSSTITKTGGPYAYAETAISPRVGFVTGWMWVFENIVSGATVSLGMASYLVSMFPELPMIPVAVSFPLLLTILNIIGVKQSSILNTLLNVLKLSVLFLFIAIGLSHLNFNYYIPFMPNGVEGILRGAALIFFAFIGFGRAPTAAEEIKNPEKTIPRSIILALSFSAVVYVLTGFVTIGLENYQALSQSGAPIADAAARIAEVFWLKILVSVAAIAATLSVLLTTLIGVSRVTYAMARDNDLPKFLGKVHNRFHTPHLAIVLTGVATAIFPLIGDIQQTASVTNFGALFVYSIVNLSAIFLVRKSSSRTNLRAIPLYIGFVSCVMLMLFLNWQSWVIGVVWIAVGFTYYWIHRKHTHHS